ncbi:putative ATP-dependent DNA helicase MER3 [Chiua virens]|nr:putative ATP-dependent DNA helicase MER3 [Chiua virens]
MNRNTGTFGNWVTTQHNSFVLHEDGRYMERFPSPAPGPLDAIRIYRDFPGVWNHTEHTPSPPESQESYAHLPLPSVKLYGDGHNRSEERAFGFLTGSFQVVRNSSHGQRGHFSDDMHMDRSEMPGSCRPTVSDQPSSWVPRPTSPDERSLEDHAAAISGNTTRNGFGWRLRPVSELPDRFRGVFKFGVFNAIQSACFDQVLHSEENLVISAPTGSGKTVLFELSMIRMFTQSASDPRSAKCVYVAPTKALCAEKHNEWTAKFGGLGIKCCELTGDTLTLGRGVWGDAKSSHIIVTTAEKWDSLTRNWSDHARILSQIKLFLVDEVHILNESRGSTLEVVISRMKARGSGTRFLLISATVPNVEDVACWIGSADGSDQPAKIFQFGDEFRPCKLTKFVYGVPKPKGQNDFAYARILDLRLFPVIQQHSTHKPILIFCPTRKGTLDAAKQLAKDYERAMKEKKNLPWRPPTRIDQKFHDNDLTTLASLGIAVHHAGLSTDDRRAVEDLYLRKVLRVLIATSTLAVGVNLPAQMVVIKGVKLYQNGEMREYSDLDIMQMMGRAGRPQFDDEGIAIILCEPELEYKYRTLVRGNTALESSLHQNLAEHLNSEIGLGTISTIENAKDWLRHSFFYRRIQRNPRHYDIGKCENQTWEEKVDEIVMQSILSLCDTQLISYTEKDGRLSSTEYGDVMSKFYIRQTTMRAILNLPSSTTMREILELVSVSEEVSDLKLRNGEKAMFEKIRRHNDIRFPLKNLKAITTSDKVLLLIQGIFAGIPFNSPEFKPTEGQPYLEAVSIFRHATRIVSAAAEVAIINHRGAQLKHALELVRCFSAKAWEDRPLVLRQIEHIGEKSVKVLTENGINTIQRLLQMSPLRIEELLNRRPPFGFEVLAAANEFPRYHLNIKELKSMHSDGSSPVEVEFAVQCGVISGDSLPQRVKKQKWGKIEMTTLLVVTSDMVFIDFRRVATKELKENKEFTLTAQLTKPSQVINVYIASEKFAGVTVSRTLAPNVPPNKYPTMETRPLISLEMDLQGLEDIPDFWDIDLDDEDEVLNSHEDVSKRPGADGDAIKLQQRQLNSPVKQQMERDPRKRPDGKYECNHPCKDKLKCRHLCCQEGLLEPPRATKKKGITRDSDAKSVPQPRKVITAGSLQDEQRKRQAVLNQSVPESRSCIQKNSHVVHENANATSNPLLVVPSLELTNRSKKSRSDKAMPNFDLQLATLKRSRSPSPVLTDGSCDEFPLISEGWEQDNMASEEADGYELPPPSKRRRADVGITSCKPSLSPQKVKLHKNPRPSTELSEKRLFLSDPDSDVAAERCNSHSVTTDPTFYRDHSGSRAPAFVVGRVSANDWDVKQTTSGQWSRDNANTHLTLLRGTFGTTTPLGNTRRFSPSALRKKSSYEDLSPSRFRGFIRRPKPYSQDDRTVNDSTANLCGLSSPARKHDETGEISFQTPTDTRESRDATDDDPLAEFDRWVASGAVEIVSD